MKKFALMAALAVALFSCNSNKNANQADTQAEEQEQATAQDLNGSWRLVDFAGETEPQVMDSTQHYVMILSDGQMALNTDCNTINSSYEVNGDSIKFDHMISTLMDCPDRTVEVGMAHILPRVDTYAVLSDTVLVLRSDARTMATLIKENEE